MELEWGQQPPAPRKRRRFGSFAQLLGRRLRDTALYDTPLWRSGIGGPWLLSFAAFAAVMAGVPTGLGRPADLVAAAGAATLLLAAEGYAIAALLSLLGVKLPRLFTGCVLGSAASVMVILCNSDIAPAAAAAVAGVLAAAGALAGLAAGLLRTGRILPGLLLLAALAAAPLLASAGAQLLPGLAGSAGLSAGAPAADQAAGDTGAVPKLEAADPGQPGAYAYRTFTYGSGKDLHRSEYAGEAGLLSVPADASAYTGKWPALRSFFWGFGPESLPLNGRVWMPEGSGPFPLVLIVHGNHIMESFSDEGYAYLGEQLASRGFIAVSLDENFLNYSAWSGIPDQDYKLRAWIILKHLEQLARFSDTPGNAFYGKIDYARTALIGHSRGGQAVAMAADAGRWFKSDAVMAAAKRFRISAVAALAPTDTTVDGQQAELRDVSYLTLQGARDGDVHDFYGDRQYIRSFYTAGSGAFKASLYIGSANHSQFNTEWGQLDLASPTGLFLSRSGMMDGEEQRRIAKVYVTAFLETTLHGSPDYEGLFQDYRQGREWLPSGTSYFNRYQDGNFTLLAGFDEDLDAGTASLGATAEISGLHRNEAFAEDRQGSSKGTSGVVLERTDGKAADAYYRLLLASGPQMDAVLSGAEGLSLSMANLNAESGSSPSPVIEIELTDRQGERASVLLSSVMTPLPLPVTQFTRLPWLEDKVSDGKFGEPSEAVFQTYRLPLERFTSRNARFDPGSLASITFHLQGTHDKIMLDDIGFYGMGNSPITQTALTGFPVKAVVISES